MSISTRLTAALTGTALLLFGLVGYALLVAEESELRGAVARETRLLGRSLQVAFENALRDRQEEDVEETLRELERLAPEVDVLVYDAEGRAVASSTGAQPRPSWRGTHAASSDLRFVPEPSPTTLELLLPLRLGREGRPWKMVLVRPLDALHADLRTTRRRVVLAVAAFAFLVALLTMLLARVWVGRPLARMVAHMRRVRSGDYSAFDHRAGGDEIGETLREFEHLVSELGAARERLESEVEARRRMEESLRRVDKLVTVGQLAAGLAHEIGSPLQILEGRLASLRTKSEDAAETRRIAGISLEQTRRITRIVSRLGALGRRRPPAPGPVDPIPAIRAVVELIEVDFSRRGVELAVALRSSTRVRADSDAIQQIVLNLLRNALDATSPGDRVWLDLDVPPEEPGHMRIEVRDSGKGMDPEVVARCFEPFFTTRAESGGSGLGLAVVKGIVDELGGRVDVRATLGEGSTFWVELPLAIEDGEKA